MSRIFLDYRFSYTDINSQDEVLLGSITITNSKQHYVLQFLKFSDMEDLVQFLNFTFFVSKKIIIKIVLLRKSFKNFLEAVTLEAFLWCGEGSGRRGWWGAE